MYTNTSQHSYVASVQVMQLNLHKMCRREACIPNADLYGLENC